MEESGDAVPSKCFMGINIYKPEYLRNEHRKVHDVFYLTATEYKKEIVGMTP